MDNYKGEMIYHLIYFKGNEILYQAINEGKIEIFKMLLNDLCYQKNQIIKILEFYTVEKNPRQKKHLLSNNDNS